MESTSVFNAAMRFCHSSAGRLVCRNFSREASSMGVAEGEEGPMAIVAALEVGAGFESTNGRSVERVWGIFGGKRLVFVKGRYG